MRARVTNWHLGLYLIVVGALAIRIWSVLHYFAHPVIWGDAFYYHGAANLLVEGKGFINPYPYYLHHQTVQAADFPPLYTLYLSLASLVGAKSYLAHQIWSCVLGAGTVGVVGFAGREVAGPRTGLLAAGIAAVYPNFWINDDLVHSETLSMFLVALTIYVSMRLWRSPRLLTAGVLGLVLGLAVLARDELILLVPLLLLPVTLLARSEGLRLAWRQRLKMAGVGVLVVVLCIAPWSGYNLTRFSNPELVSTGLGVTLATANCDKTYYGSLIGFWSLPCSSTVKLPPGDESVADAYLRHHALSYVDHHLSRLPVVLAARVGREFGLYAPTFQVNLDVLIEQHPKRPAFVGLGMYYVLALLSVAGAVILRRRRVTLLPFAAVLTATVLSALIAFGQTRYRSPTEVVLVLLGAVAIDAALARWWPSRADRAEGAKGYRHSGGASRPEGQDALRPGVGSPVMRATG